MPHPSTPSHHLLRQGPLAFLLLALAAPALPAEEPQDRVLAAVAQLRGEAVEGVERARARLAAAEGDLAAARSALDAARAQGSAAAAAVAGEAMQVADEERRDAERLVALASRRLAARQALSERFAQAGAQSPRRGSFALPLDGPVQRAGPDGRPSSDPAAPLQRGETVTTGSGGSAHLLFEGGDVDVGLGADSALTFVEETVAGIEAALQRGQLRLKALVLKNRKKFEVRTPSAICGIRGTAYRLEVGAGREVLTVTEGEVEVRRVDGGEVVLVRAGQQLSFGGPGAWRGPVPAPRPAEEAR